MIRNELNELAREIHAQAAEKGFWDVEDAMVKHIAKMHSELSEALQEDRMGHPMLYVDDIDALERITDPDMFDGRKPEGIAAELADFVMMTLDALENDEHDVWELYNVYRNGVRKECTTFYLEMPIYSLVTCMHDIITISTYKMAFINSYGFIKMVLCIELWLEQRGVDIWKVVRLKLTYNKSRPALHGRKY